MKRYLILLFSVFTSLLVHAQEGGETLDDLFEPDYDTPLTVNLDDEESEEEVAPVVKKKKKVNPKIYYGIKTKRGYTKTGFGSRTVVELFHYLKDKDFEGPPPYTEDFFYYDFKDRKLVNSTKIDRKYAGVLHGHYVQKMGNKVLQEGYYYKGLKHGRWVRYNSNDILMEKEVYHKGRTEQSKLSYYDFNKTKVKEVLPIHYGDRQGEYYAYHENGRLALKGEFLYDHRIGIWMEYYENGRRKREVKYPEDPFAFDVDPKIIREWDKAGRLIFDREKMEASLR